MPSGEGSQISKEHRLHWFVGRCCPTQRCARNVLGSPGRRVRLPNHPPLGARASPKEPAPLSSLCMAPPRAPRYHAEDVARTKWKDLAGGRALQGLLAEVVRRGLALKTELLKTSPNRYTVVLDGEGAGEVWNWHGSWSARVRDQSFHGLKSRKLATKQVEQIYQLKS